MPESSGRGAALSEAEVRAIVREEIGDETTATPSRRQLLGALGAAGMAGLAGCGSPLDSQNTATEAGATNGTRPRGSYSRRQSGVYVAEPSAVQSAIDDAAADGVGEVRLVSGRTYEVTTPIRLRDGVALDCTGATIAATADVDVFELQTHCQIRNPTVRTTDVDGYSSSVFHVFPNPQTDGFGSGGPMPVWTVAGGWSEMTPGEGTCIELHGVRENPGLAYDVSRDNRNVYFCHVAHNCLGGYRFAYLHRDGGTTTRGGHVNGNIVRGLAQNTTRFVETTDSAEGKNMVNGNRFELVTQPGPASEWLWYAEKGEMNELCEWGKNWDYARYSDTDGDGYAESWYIGPDAGTNYVWRKQGGASGGLGSTVVDESNGESGSRYLVLDHLGTPVQDLSTWSDAQ